MSDAPFPGPKLAILKRIDVNAIPKRVPVVWRRQKPTIPRLGNHGPRGMLAMLLL
jgi:hypothetical protein